MVCGGYKQPTTKIMGLFMGRMLVLANILTGCSSPVMGNIIICGDMASSNFKIDFSQNHNFTSFAEDLPLP